MGDAGQQRVLQINMFDGRGGASTVALGLHRAFRGRGMDARMAVRRKFTDDPDIFAIRNEEARTWRAKTLLGLDERMQAARGGGETTWASRLLRWAGDPGRAWEIRRGLENFSFPGTWRLLDQAGFRPTIIHCHNLHANYFDLRALPWLSRVAPVVVTLHDAWMLSGHCAHSLGCDRWKTGCGACPDLTLEPGLIKDGTAENWRRKRSIFARSRLHVVTPSQWMMDRAGESMLAPAIRSARVIANGVDLAAFHPADRAQARAALKLPASGKVLSFVSDRVADNPYKDWRTLTAALERLAAGGHAQNLTFLAVGEGDGTSHIGPIEVRHVPYTHDPRQLALYYLASDIYVHAARAESFGLAVAEALACGTPVIASGVGGVPEVVRHGRTGLLVKPGDPTELASAIEELLAAPERAAAWGAEGARDIADRLSLERNVAAYLDFYQDAQATFAGVAQGNRH